MLAPTRFGLAILVATAAGVAAPGGGPKLASPYQHYELKLSPLFTPPAHAMGLSVKARIDSGPTLRFLLDSGAEYIVLNKRTAASLGTSSDSPLDLVGLGASTKPVRRLAPATVEVGGLLFRDCQMLAVDDKLIEGIDGIMPLSLFADFMVHLDVPSKTLDLDPYPADPPVEGSGYTRVRDNHHLLFLPVFLNDSLSGYVLFDTGATYSVVAPKTARSLKNYRIIAQSISLRGGTGDTEGFLLPPGCRFRFGSQVVSVDPAVVVDLSDLVKHHQFEVAGVLGYPALRRSIVTIDYRDSLVRLESK